ncbi:Gfo/Idh/MocA family oxidoreductase, partial [bacterium]|nr:Gfo/Idh/MocA family oxidoreductase [bacterium]
MGGFLGFKELRVVAVCDVHQAYRETARNTVNSRYGNNDCAGVNDFRAITERPDIDAVFCATPDHWHALITVSALKHGKDVYCEKPESLTIHEGRVMSDTARRYGRVFSGGSQRVWQDYNWYHRVMWSGAAGELQEIWVNIGGPSGACYLPAEPVPEGLDWDMWLGPAPWR